MANQQIQVIFFDLGETLVIAPRVWLPGAESLLNSLKRRGFRLGIISNIPGLPNRQAILNLLPEDFDLDLFEPTLVLFSSEAGLAKPDREVFKKAVAFADVSAEQCLYCSENIVESLAGQHVGMRYIRVQTAPNSDLASIEQALALFHSLI
jgi:putative hydrolase of the HAD superfamily